jgi:hypothetical protein
MGAEIGAVISRRIGDGLVGLNLRVELLDAAPDVPATVVLKLPSLDETSRATGVALRNYEREVKFYLQVASTVDIRVPHCHFGEWDESTGDFTLVLEDMAPAEQGNQLTGCSAPMATSAIEELAKLHAPRWDDPGLHDLDWLGRRSNAEDVAAIAGLWAMFLPPFLATYSKHLTSDQLDLLGAFGGELEGWMGGRDGPQAVTHGDYRLDNLLFGSGSPGDSSPAVTAVDWQTPGHGPPVADLSYFCGAGLLPADRRLHDRALVAAYGAALAARGVDVSESWLWEQYRREAFGGVIMAVVASQVVGESERSESLFAVMASRHLQHALDLDALELI